MAKTVDELKADYEATLAELTAATTEVQRLMGTVEPINNKPTPVISEELAAAHGRQAGAQKAYDAARDAYYAVR